MAVTISGSNIIINSEWQNKSFSDIISKYSDKAIDCSDLGKSFNYDYFNDGSAMGNSNPLLFNGNHISGYFNYIDSSSNTYKLIHAFIDKNLTTIISYGAGIAFPGIYTQEYDSSWGILIQPIALTNDGKLSIYWNSKNIEADSSVLSSCKIINSSLYTDDVSVITKFDNGITWNEDNTLYVNDGIYTYSLFDKNNINISNVNIVKSDCFNEPHSFYIKSLKSHTNKWNQNLSIGYIYLPFFVAIGYIESYTDAHTIKKLENGTSSEYYSEFDDVYRIISSSENGNICNSGYAANEKHRRYGLVLLKVPITQKIWAGPSADNKPTFHIEYDPNGDNSGFATEFPANGFTNGSSKVYYANDGKWFDNDLKFIFNDPSVQEKKYSGNFKWTAKSDVSVSSSNNTISNAIEVFDITLDENTNSKPRYIANIIISGHYHLPRKTINGITYDARNFSDITILTETVFSQAGAGTYVSFPDDQDIPWNGFANTISGNINFLADASITITYIGNSNYYYDAENGTGSALSAYKTLKLKLGNGSIITNKNKIEGAISSTTDPADISIYITTTLSNANWLNNDVNIIIKATDKSSGNIFDTWTITLSGSKKTFNIVKSGTGWTYDSTNLRWNYSSIDASGGITSDPLFVTSSLPWTVTTNGTEPSTGYKIYVGGTSSTNIINAGSQQNAHNTSDSSSKVYFYIPNTYSNPESYKFKIKNIITNFDYNDVSISHKESADLTINWIASSPSYDSIPANASTYDSAIKILSTDCPWKLLVIPQKSTYSASDVSLTPSSGTITPSTGKNITVKISNNNTNEDRLYDISAYIVNDSGKVTVSKKITITQKKSDGNEVKWGVLNPETKPYNNFPCDGGDFYLDVSCKVNWTLKISGNIDSSTIEGTGDRSGIKFSLRSNTNIVDDPATQGRKITDASLWIGDSAVSNLQISQLAIRANYDCSFYDGNIEKSKTDTWAYTNISADGYSYSLIKVKNVGNKDVSINLSKNTGTIWDSDSSVWFTSYPSSNTVNLAKGNTINISFGIVKNTSASSKSGQFYIKVLSGNSEKDSRTIQLSQLPGSSEIKFEKTSWWENNYNNIPYSGVTSDKLGFRIKNEGTANISGLSLKLEHAGGSIYMTSYKFVNNNKTYINDISINSGATSIWYYIIIDDAKSTYDGNKAPINVSYTYFEGGSQRTGTIATLEQNGWPRLDKVKKATYASSATSGDPNGHMIGFEWSGNETIDTDQYIEFNGDPIIIPDAGASAILDTDRKSVNTIYILNTNTTTENKNVEVDVKVKYKSSLGINGEGNAAEIDNISYKILPAADIQVIGLESGQYYRYIDGIGNCYVFGPGYGAPGYGIRSFNLYEAQSFKCNWTISSVAQNKISVYCTPSTYSDNTSVYINALGSFNGGDNTSFNIVASTNGFNSDPVNVKLYRYPDPSFTGSFESLSSMYLTLDASDFKYDNTYHEYIEKYFYVEYNQNNTVAKYEILGDQTCTVSRDFTRVDVNTNKIWYKVRIAKNTSTLKSNSTNIRFTYNYNDSIPDHTDDLTKDFVINVNPAPTPVLDASFLDKPFNYGLTDDVSIVTTSNYLPIFWNYEVAEYGTSGHEFEVLKKSNDILSVKYPTNPNTTKKTCNITFKYGYIGEDEKYSFTKTYSFYVDVANDISLNITYAGGTSYPGLLTDIDPNNIPYWYGSNNYAFININAVDASLPVIFNYSDEESGTKGNEFILEQTSSGQNNLNLKVTLPTNTSLTDYKSCLITLNYYYQGATAENIYTRYLKLNVNPAIKPTISIDPVVFTWSGNHLPDTSLNIAVNVPDVSLQTVWEYEAYESGTDGNEFTMIKDTNMLKIVGVPKNTSTEVPKKCNVKFWCYYAGSTDHVNDSNCSGVYTVNYVSGPIMSFDANSTILNPVTAYESVCGPDASSYVINLYNIKDLSGNYTDATKIELDDEYISFDSNIIGKFNSNVFYSDTSLFEIKFSLYDSEIDVSANNYINIKAYDKTGNVGPNPCVLNVVQSPKVDYKPKIHTANVSVTANTTNSNYNLGFSQYIQNDASYEPAINKDSHIIYDSDRCVINDYGISIKPADKNTWTTIWASINGDLIDSSMVSLIGGDSSVLCYNLSLPFTNSVMKIYTDKMYEYKSVALANYRDGKQDKTTWRNEQVDGPTRSFMVYNYKEDDLEYIRPYFKPVEKVNGYLTGTEIKNFINSKGIVFNRKKNKTIDIINWYSNYSLVNDTLSLDINNAIIDLVLHSDSFNSAWNYIKDDNIVDAKKLYIKNNIIPNLIINDKCKLDVYYDENSISRGLLSEYDKNLTKVENITNSLNYNSETNTYSMNIKLAKDKQYCVILHIMY